MPRRRGPKPQGRTPEILDVIQQQLYRDAGVIVQELQGDIQPYDSIPVSRNTNRDYIRNGWQDQQFRMDLLNRIGPEEFLKQSHDAFGIPMPSEDKFAEVFGLAPMKLPKIVVPSPPQPVEDGLMEEEETIPKEPIPGHTGFTRIDEFGGRRTLPHQGAY